jgi:hypothetical protein
MKTRFIFPKFTALCALALTTNVQAQTFSTPAFNGSGAAANNRPNTQVSTNFNSGVSQNSGAALGTSVGTNTSSVVGGTNALSQPATALGQPAPALGQPTPALGSPATALGQPATAIGQQGNTAIGQQGTTAIGQQGSGTAIIPPGTNALNPSGTAINPSGNVTAGASNPATGTITNGFVVNGDGTVTALPGAGSTAITPGGTNSGTGTSPPNFFQTNSFRQP